MTINLDLLDEESATAAIETVAEIAVENDANWALVGGVRESERKRPARKKTGETT